jgi:hypothetical protein
MIAIAKRSSLAQKLSKVVAHRAPKRPRGRPPLAKYHEAIVSCLVGTRG